MANLPKALASYGNANIETMVYVCMGEGGVKSVRRWLSIGSLRFVGCLVSPTDDDNSDPIDPNAFPFQGVLGLYSTFHEQSC